MIKAFEPKGFIASFLKQRGVFDEAERRNEEVRDQSSSGTRKKQISAVQFDIEPACRYNRVDAAHLGLSLDARLQNTPRHYGGTERIIPGQSGGPMAVVSYGPLPITGFDVARQTRYRHQRLRRSWQNMDLERPTLNAYSHAAIPEPCPP